ncbi:MAG: FtsX-like permease family protein [Treponema sp.]|nr:FtsX-like permease family protein [Treponema sp.]
MSEKIKREVFLNKGKFKISIERRLALINLSKKPYRSFCLSLLSALSAGILFASLLLSSCLKGGISGLTSRLGADLLVVPQGYEKGAENILLYGQPGYFYMDRSVLDKVASLPGVKKASAQFYLTSLSESCCDFPVQLIGFDPESDFVVQKWARNKRNLDRKAGRTKQAEKAEQSDWKDQTEQSEKSGMKDRAESSEKAKLSGKEINALPAQSQKPSEGKEVLLCGSNINAEKNTVCFFGQAHTISSKLSKSGSGMDNVIFCDLPTLEKIFQDAKKRGFGFISDGDTHNKISTVLVQLEKDTQSESLASKIKNEIEGVQVIQGEKFLRTFSEKLSSILVFLHLIAALVFLICGFSLGLVYSITINERHREFSILRVLGADRGLLKRILFREALILASSGSITGTGLAALFIIPFSSLLSTKFSLPFLSRSPQEILLLAGLSITLTTLSCLLASLSGAVKVSKRGLYGDVK